MQRSGPRKPLQGTGVGGIWSSDVPAAGRASGTTLRARSALRSSLSQIPSECRLLANKARFHQFYCKVSQNGEVSSKSVEKACHSP